jgi:hypothetical protein
MENEQQIQAIVKSLKSEFYIWFSILVVLAVLSFVFGGSMDKLNPSLTISLQSLLLLAMLVGIPGTLVWFRNKMKLINEISAIPIRLGRYEKYSRIRQSVFFIMELLVLFMQVFTVMKGALMLFMVVLVISFFIVPSRGRLMMEAGLLKPEEAEKAEEDMGSE